MKVVINACHGGFNLSPEAFMRYAELKGIKLYAYVDESHDNYQTHKVVPYVGQTDMSIFSGPFFATQLCATEDELWEHIFNDNKIERNDPCLVQTVEELGDKANGDYAALKVVEIPNNTILEESDKAYLAGLVEGDGCISVVQKRDRKTLTYGPTVSIQLKDKIILEKVVRIVGKSKVSGPYGKKQMYAWRVYSQTAIKVISDIYPYLVCKQNQAKICYRFYNLQFERTGVKYTPEQIDERKKLFKMCQGYNQREIVDNINLPEPRTQMLKWHIAEYDGCEHVAEDHRTWG